MLDYQPRSRRRTSAREVRRVRPERHNPRSIATLRIAIARQLLGQLPHCPFCGASGSRLIFSIHVYFRDAGLWAGMVGRCVPCTFEQLHSAEFLQRNTAPVCRRAGRLQSTATLPSILIAQHTNLAFVIPAQPVRTEPPIAAVIDGSNRTFANHGRPDQSINVLDRLDLRLDNTHLLHDTRLSPGSSMDSIIYNTVILGSLTA